MREKYCVLCAQKCNKDKKFCDICLGLLEELKKRSGMTEMGDMIYHLYENAD